MARKRGTAAFLLAEGILYALFLSMDLTALRNQTVPVKYAGILLCLGFALLSCLKWRGDGLVPLALALTAGADWFLLVRNDHYAVGIALFLCVQAVYYIRLRRMGAGAAYPLRAGLALAAGLGLYVQHGSGLEGGPSRASVRRRAGHVRGVRCVCGAVQRPACRLSAVFRRVCGDVVLLPPLPSAHRPVRPMVKGGPL